MAMSRSQKKAEFARELYLAASFFKMKSLSNGKEAIDGTKLDSSRVEKIIRQETPNLQPFPHPEVTEKYISPREPWTQRQQKTLVRGEAVEIINRANDKATLEEATPVWIVKLITSLPINSDFRADFFPRKTHYKKDAEELKKEVEKAGGRAIVEKIEK